MPSNHPYRVLFLALISAMLCMQAAHAELYYIPGYAKSKLDDSNVHAALKGLIQALPKAQSAPDTLKTPLESYLTTAKEWYGSVCMPDLVNDPDKVLKESQGLFSHYLGPLTPEFTAKIIETPVGKVLREKPLTYGAYAIPHSKELWTSFKESPPKHRWIRSNLGMEWDPKTKRFNHLWSVDRCEALSSISYVRINQWGSAEQCALFFWEGKSWYGLEYLAFPNGMARELTCWHDGRIVSACLWDLDKKAQLFSAEKLPKALARMHPEIPAFSPTPVVDLATFSPAYCQIDLQLPGASAAAPKNQANKKLPAPCLALLLGEKGVKLKVEAPEIAPYTFLGWEGSMQDEGKPLSLVLAEEVVLTARYGGAYTPQKKNRVEGPKLLAALRKALKIPTSETLTFEALAKLKRLDLSHSDLKYAKDLAYLTNLEELDLSGNRFERSPLPGKITLFRDTVRTAITLSSHAPLNFLFYILATQPVSRLETLILDNNPLNDHFHPEAMDTLRTLSLRETGFKHVGSLRHLISLEQLKLDGNGLPGKAPLYPELINLKHLSLKNNSFSSVEKLPKSAPDRLGLVINLEANPLSDQTLYEQIPAFSKIGITFKYTGETTVPSLQEDDDGDGFSNAEERRFVSLFYADRQRTLEEYEKAISDPTVPKDYLERLPNSLKVPRRNQKEKAQPENESLSIDTIPTRWVRIRITGGSGELYPGNGAHRFAKYLFNDDQSWDFNEVTFRAIPAKGWAIQPPKHINVFERIENGGSLVHTNEDGAEWRINMSDYNPPQLDVTFVKSTKSEAENLYADYERFVQEFCPGEDPLHFDRNIMGRGPDGFESFPEGDGIPDGAQIRQVMGYLNDPAFRQDARCGPYRHSIIEAWERHLSCAKGALGDLGKQKPYLINVVAAYSMVHGYAGSKALKDLIEKKTGHSMDCSSFTWGTFTDLLADENATCDSGINLRTWKDLSRGYENSIELFDLFVKATLYPKD